MTLLFKVASIWCCTLNNNVSTKYETLAEKDEEVTAQVFDEQPKDEKQEKEETCT